MNILAPQAAGKNAALEEGWAARKNAAWTKTVAVLTAVIMLAGCGQQGTKTQSPSAEDFAPYIKAYTGGIVPEDASIRIELAQDAAQMPTEGLFTTSPKTSGTVLWTGPGSVSYTPDKLEAGKVYSVRFALGKVAEHAPEVFEFSLAVKGRTEPVPEPEEEDNGMPLRIKKAALGNDRVEVTVTGTPVNANVKGIVELKGAARYYVQVQDSLITVHFEGAGKEIELSIDQSLKDESGNALGSTYTKSFRLQDDKPAIEIPLSGNILPDRQALILPFRAVNLGAVEVRVVKIYEKNVLTFLQDNNLDGNSGLRRSGRLIYHGDIPLDASKDLHKWNTHSIDISGLFRQEPGAIYRIRLSFRQDQSLWGGKQYIFSPRFTGSPTDEDNAEWDKASPYYWDNDYDWDSYNYKEADDPEKPSYYMDSDRFPSVQLIASDLGLMAGYAGGENIWIATTDLISARPVGGAQVEVFDYQLQRIAKGCTDNNGLAQLSLTHKPFAVVAKAGGSTAYLKISGGKERMLSRFDTGGETVQQGLKAFLYGERGVWRPGDTLHVNAIVADKGRNLPQGHPATLEVYTPEGSFYARITRKGTDSFYSFDIPTKADDPTGYWNAYLKIGGCSFHKTLHVETIKPNRLKITTSLSEGTLLEAGKTVKVTTGAAWLTGSPAGGNKARAQITLKPAKGCPFKGFEKYSFTDLSSAFRGVEQNLYETVLDGTGNTSINVMLPKAEGAPGMLQATIMTSVQEDGGDESFTVATMPFSAYKSYVGIKVPEGEYLETDKNHIISLAAVGADGKRMAGRKIEYGVYKLQWNWWWESPGVGELDSYVNGGSASRIAGGEVTSSATADATFSIREDYPAWGRYMILARDKDSGHVSGRIVTIDWPEYRGRASRKDPDALTSFTFSTDKTSYTTGEKATAFIPAAKGGRALVSFENAAGVLRREWVELSEKDTPFQFDITPEMAPNFYLNITLLQPYGAIENDLPIRLYGVQRVTVENPASHLKPIVDMPGTIHPEETFTVKVSEANGKPMTYTLAIVDEGLLDLTAFKTPDPWSKMYKSEALGVNTWDMYDSVIGAFGGKISPIAAIGGDQETIQNARKDNRFNPVVLCLPPRTITKGTDVLKLKLPMYVGSVRVMLVAAHDGAYGNAEKTVSVQNPLMVVTTLPRLLGTGEEVSVPVNVFAMEEGVKEASVSIKADGPVSITGVSSQKLKFSGKGDKMVRFGIKATGEGTARITVSASGSGHNATETIALPVGNPYPEVTSVKRFTLEKGASRSIEAGCTLELAGFPALNAGQLFLDMKNYPFNCSEQLSARGITMLSLLPMLGADEKESAKALLPGIVNSLYARQNADGGFAYWPGGNSNGWVSSMAGLFLTLASRETSVNPGVLQAWKKFQKKSREDKLDEAYCLYTLAIAGEPQLARMNRLKESARLQDIARWMLASTYAISGKAALADAVLEGIGRDFPEYESLGITYGSSLRDRMIALEALSLTGRAADALALAADAMPEGGLSTQESAFAAVAYRALWDKIPGSGISAKLGNEDITSLKSSVRADVSKVVEISNTGDGPLYGTVLTSSRESRSKAVENGIKLEVNYVSEDGKALNPASLAQGTRFKAVIKVTNASKGIALESMALNFGIPSGWEIINERLSGAADAIGGYDHLDIRDNGARWFFGLPAGRFKTFTIGLRAAYSGTYVLPSTVCTDMYHPAVSAATADGKATVK